MSNENKYEVLDYRVGRLEKVQENAIATVEKVANNQNNLVTSLEVLKTKIAMYAAGIGIVVSIIVSVTTNFINYKVKSYSEADKNKYYNKRVNDSDVVKELKAEIARLKKEKLE